MKRSAIVKIVADVWMTLLLLFLMGYQLWGEVAHEWAGAGMLVLFLAHHILNRGWYKSLFKGRYTPMRVFRVLVDMLLLAAMAAQMYSSIAMSRHVFAFLPLDGKMALARRLHILGAYWGFILMSVHLGMHWNLFLGMARKRTGKTVPSKLRSSLLFLMGLLIAAYGAFVFVDRDFPTYLFLRSEFVFLDYEEPVWSFYLDYLDVLEGRAERFARDPARIRKAEEGNKMKRNWPNVNVPAEWEKKDIYKPVFLNRYGYYELRRQNTPEERGRNFEENYFQNYAGQTYAKEYPESELAFIRNKIEERELVIRENLQKAGKNPEEGYSLLDIGCGEGFLLKHFYDRGVRVKGIDFGVYALKHFHPELCSCFEQGDMMKLLPQMAARGEVYDVVNADRMLDMVPDAGEDGGGIPSAGRNGIWPGDCGGFSERMNSARTY